MDETPRVEPHIQAGKDLTEEQYGNAIVRAKNWRFFALGLLLLSGIATGGLIHVGSKPQQIPAYILVDSCTHTMQPLGALPANYVPDNKVIAKTLWLLVEAMRSVSTDKEWMKERWRRAFYSFTEDGQRAYLALFEKEKPLEKDEPVKVELQNVIRQTENTYYLRWTERRYTRQMVPEAPENWSGVFTFKQRKPETPDEWTWAPEGVYVQEWSFTKEP